MPRILKKNYENAIARHPEARKLRVSYPSSSKITLKKLMTITNKFKIGVGPSRSKANAFAVKYAKPLVSQRKIQNKINADRLKKASAKSAAQLKARMAKKKEATMINNLVNEIVKNIVTEADLTYVLTNVGKKPRTIGTVSKSRKKSVVKPRTIGTGSKSRKKSVVKPIPKTPVVKRRRAVPIIKK